MDKLQLEVLLKAIDQATAPLRAIREGSGEMAKAVREAKGALKELEKQQGLVDKFREVKLATEETETQWKAATDRVRSLKLEMDATDEPTRKMARAFEVAKKEAGELKDKHGELLAKQQGMRSSLSEVGIGTINLAEHQRKLHGDIAQATAAFERQSAALEAHGERMRKTIADQAEYRKSIEFRNKLAIAAQAEYRKSIEFRNKLATGGAVTMGAGIAMGAPILGAVKASAEFEDAMLGVARQVEGAKDANGNYTQTYHDMAREIKAMSEQIPMAAGNIAQIVEAGARMGIQGKDNLTTYAKLTATMATAFDLPVEETGVQIGKLSDLYKIPIKDIHQLGDSINWLDDNAKSKGGDIINVMQRIAGTATTLNMSYKDAAALGSTFLSLGAGAEVAASASNAMMRELSVATMQGKRFQSGLSMLGLDAKKLQDAMGKDATGTIIKVMEAINKLPDESRLEAATRLFGKEYGDDAAKLATNMGEYRRQLALVNDEQGKGSMDKEMQSRLKTQSAQYELVKNSVSNLSGEIGDTLKPTLIDLMKSTADVLKDIRAWARENPELLATIVKIAAVVSIAAIGFGALALGVAAILGPLAGAKLAMNILGINGFGISKIFTGLGNLFPWLGKVFMTLGRVVMANPILAVVAALGLAALYVWKNWDEIKPRLAKAWGYLVSSYASIKNLIKTKFSELSAWFKKLPSEFLGIGKSIVGGIINGIKAKWGALKDTVIGLGKESIGWLKNTLGIKSPSKVFQELGIYTMQGLEQGITGGQGAPLAAIARMSKQLAGAGAGMMIGTAALAGGINNRPPLAAGGMGGGYTVINHITIQATPGMNEKSLAEEVARQIDELERARAARSRSRFGDRA